MDANRIPRYLEIAQKLTGEVREQMQEALAHGDHGQFMELAKEMLRAAITGGLDIPAEIRAIQALARLEGVRGAADTRSTPAAVLKLLERRQQVPG